MHKRKEENPNISARDQERGLEGHCRSDQQPGHLMEGVAIVTTPPPPYNYVYIPPDTPQTNTDTPTSPPPHYS
jgi:hypothetical protein